MFASNDNGSLRQGQQFKTMQKMFDNVVKNIGKSKYVGIEGANGDDDKTKMEVLVDEFKKTLIDYKSAYRRHLASSMANNDVKKYYGNTIKAEGSDEIFYITRKGVKRKLQAPPLGTWSETGQNGWNAITDSHKCPRILEENTVDPQVISKWEVEGEDLGYKKRDEPMDGELYYFQKCPSGGDKWADGGVFITKDGTAGGTLAWYDHKAKRHDFKDNVTRDLAHNSCPKRSGKTYLIPAIEFNNLMPKTNTKLDENTPCPNIIQGGENNITSLNNRLIDLAIEMKTEINSINQRSGDTDQASSEAKRNLDTLIAEIKEQRKKIKTLEKEIHSLDTTIGDNTHLVKSINLRYIAWGISLITIGLIGMHQLKK